MADYSASPVTVAKAMRTLRSLGLVESRPGVGTFVRAVRSARLPDYGWQTAALRSPQARIPALSTPLRSVAPDVIALHSGYPMRELLPERLVRTAFTRAARADAALRPGARCPASPTCRAWFAQELAEAFGAGVTAPTAREVIVLPGSQSGLELDLPRTGRVRAADVDRVSELLGSHPGRGPVRCAAGAGTQWAAGP